MASRGEVADCFQLNTIPSYPTFSECVRELQWPPGNVTTQKGLSRVFGLSVQSLLEKHGRLRGEELAFYVDGNGAC